MILATFLTAQAQSCLQDSQCANDEFCARYAVQVGDDSFSTGQCVSETGVRIENENTGECLRPVGASTTSGADITMSACLNTPSRRWHQVPHSNGTVGLMNEWSGLCIEVTGSGSNAGYEQRSCLDTNDQNYAFQNESNGSVRLHQAFVGTTCVRSVSSLDDPFQSHTCSQYGHKSSRHWFLY